MPSLGERLKQAREERGYSQVYVSKHLGISNTALSNYERDYRDPDHETLEKLAKFYSVTTDWLLGLTDNKGSRIQPEKANPRYEKIVDIFSRAEELGDEDFDIIADQMSRLIDIFRKKKENSK